MLDTRDSDFELPNELSSAAPGERVPVELLHGAIVDAVEHLGDPELGLELGYSMSLGEVGPFDYLLRSAATVGEALEAAGHYSALQSDSYRILHEPWRGGGLLRLIDESSWPRPVADMAMAAAYALHVGQRAPFVSQLECWFPYPAPLDKSAYERAFPGATVCFGAPFHAFYFDASYLQAPQPGADPIVHSVLRERFDYALRDVARAATVKQRVRLAVERQLRQGGDASATAIARGLRMSRRTLSRRLEQEGTTFIDELDAVRKELALSHVCNSDRPLVEIAALLGFAHVESFHRAFKRWTGTTPATRRAQATRRVHH